MAGKVNIKLFSTSGKIASFKVIDYILDKGWAKVALIAVNLVLIWLMNGSQIRGFFDILSLIIMPFVMVLPEAMLLVIAGVAEMSAEIIADCIVPREQTASSAVRQEKAASMPKTAKSKETAVSVKPNAAILQKKPYLAIKPETNQYIHLQQERGIHVYELEVFWIWYACTMLIWLDNRDYLEDKNTFYKKSIKALFAEYPEKTKDFKFDYVWNDFNRAIETIEKTMFDRIAKNQPCQTEYECCIDVIKRRYNKSDDPVTTANLENCILNARITAREKVHS